MLLLLNEMYSFFVNLGFGEGIEVERWSNFFECVKLEEFFNGGIERKRFKVDMNHIILLV